MTTGKDTASFFENGTNKQFEYCFKLYPQVLKLKAEKRCKKPQELIRLDEWYQNELPKLIKARGKDAHMVYDELVQTMKWKQSRGKFYPQLSYLVKVNTPRAVMQETKKAFRKLPNLEQAITALSNLKGVGTTMASALLAAAAPHSAPFMADECLMAIPEIEGIDYTTKEYLNFVNHIQTTVERLNTEAGGETPIWSPHRVELALWAHYVANDLSPEMLDEMPGPGAGGGANMNGSAKVMDGGDDTTDADDESQGADNVGRGEVAGNNTATESETENENNHPTAGVLQDGDSNFVSNDSTSQEPLIDENTTQTTATTTSTDDGDEEEVVAITPLASDSESNLEAPTAKAKAKVATTTTTTTTTGVTGSAIVAPIQHAANNGGTAAATNNSTAAVVGNGNGTLHAVADSLDGSCLREEEAAAEVIDADNDDNTSSNNTNNSLLGKSVTPIKNLNDGINSESVNVKDNANETSTTPIGQKRVLTCESSSEDPQQPEMKKIRSD